MPLGDAATRKNYLLLMCSFVIPPLPHLFKSCKHFGEIRAFFVYSLVQSKCDFDLWAICNIKNYWTLLSDFI